MAWFSPLVGQRVDLSPEEIQPDDSPASLLDRGRASVENMLERFRADERALVADIEDKTEQLRQTRVAIQAFEAADKILVAGDPDFAEVEPVPELETPKIVMKHKAIRS